MHKIKPTRNITVSIEHQHKLELVMVEVVEMDNVCILGDVACECLGLPKRIETLEEVEHTSEHLHNQY